MGKLEDYLERDLSRTGYPLEIEISSLLDKTYSVSNSEYFFDEDENKAREIDISAFPTQRKFEDKKIAPFSIVHRLVIECKKSDTHAWIFLTRPQKIFWLQGQCMDFLSHVTKDAMACFIDEILSTCDYLHYGSFNSVSSIYAEIKYQGQQSRKSDKSEIFEAKNQLVKFVAYDISQLLKRLETVFDPIANHLIWLYHPIIVFDGKLYEAIIKKGVPRLFERNHLLLSTTYSPIYVKDFPKSESPELPYLIDVVSKGFFADFLQILENDYLTLHKSILNNFKKLSKVAREYLKHS